MKRIAMPALLLLMMPAFILPVSAEQNANVGYAPYTYNYEENYVATPEAYSHSFTIDGDSSGAGPFSDLYDLVSTVDGRLCLSDSGNDRVVILDQSMHFQKEIREFDGKNGRDSLSRPKGLFVTDTDLYVADSGNARILQFSLNDGTLIREYARPDISLLDDNYLYEPTRFVVTKAGKLYVIARNINQGLIELDEEGEFVSFIGAPKVSADLLDLLWRKLYTKEQRAKTMQNVPTEYSSVCLDSAGFFYVTSKSTNVSPIGRLNTQGTDVLRQSNFSKSGAVGDALYSDSKGLIVNSNFIDISVKETGVYYALDAANGRTFCYSSEGDLLYIFGASGSLDGLFQSAAAIETLEDSIYIADQRKNTIILSHVLSYEEQNFYYVLLGLIVVWILILIFSGLMMTHDYSLGKAMITVILIIIGMLLILFIALLFVYLLQESIGFLAELYEEILFRWSY